MVCSYRNCRKELINKRKDAKFCCRKCKGYEKTYIKRADDFIKLAIFYNKKIVDSVKDIEKLIKSTN